jgi:autotransporter-associated beta strand protein
LLSSAALVSTILSTFTITSTLVHADGGRGGSAFQGAAQGGAGGAGFSGATGNVGTSFAGVAGSGGGGGAAGGGNGGYGGGNGGLGGGTSASPNGADGAPDAGGGGGYGGANGTTALSINNNAPLSGQNGGNGGNGGAGSFGGGGGGGGAGGYGAIVTGIAASSDASSITGGNGGNGGNGFTPFGLNSSFAGNPGAGGDGGIGIRFSSSTTFTNTGSITGGNGGTAGTGGPVVATVGAGGAGIFVQGIGTIINSGTITGGLSGDGLARANAISFSNSGNVLELRAGSNITGTVAGSGSDTLRLGGSANSGFDTSALGFAYQGFNNFEKTGSSTWTLTGSVAGGTPWTINQGTLSITSDSSLGSPSIGLDHFVTMDGGTIRFATGVSGNRAFLLNPGGGTFDAFSGTSVLSGVISGNGSFTKTGNGTIVFNGAANYTGGTTINGFGFLLLGDSTNRATILGEVQNNSFFEIVNADTSGITKLTNYGSTTFDDGQSASSINLINGGGGSLISFTSSSIAATATVTTNNFAKTQFFGTSTGGNAQFVTNAGGIVDFSASAGPNGNNKLTAGSLAGDGAYYLGANQLTVGGSGLSSTVSGVISDCGSGADCNAIGASGGSLVKTGPGTLTLTGANTYSGGTTVAGGTLVLGGSGMLGAITNAVTVAGGTLDLGGATQIQNGGVTLTSGSITDGTLSSSGGFLVQAGTVSAALTGTGSMTKSTAGTVILTGINTFTGATFINAGTLQVDGAITSSSAVTVNAGGRLTGSGLVDPPNVITIASGATFAPGNGTAGSSMTIAGNLAFQSGALYLAQVSPSAASFANVTGTAALAGTVNAVFAPGAYLAKTYAILHSAGLGGTTFSALTTTNMPISIAASLSYSPTDVFLNLVGGLGAGSALNVNQQNVATSINSFFNNGGALPPNFSNLFVLSGAPLANSLTQIAGEVASDAPIGVFKLSDQFLRLMLDPFVDGRSGDGWLTGAPSTGAMGFAPEHAEAPPPDVARTYANVVKALPRAVIFDPHWSAWGSGFGGGNFTRGDLAVGSHDVTARDFGFAGGADYHVSPNSVVGFALAGSGTNWGLAQGLGSGRSDAFQAGAYGVTRFGAAYVAAAVAFANHWMSTDRFALAGDHLTASFNGQSYSGRLEGGYRFGLAMIGLTPYAAVQAQVFHTPTYSEAGLLAGGFALSYGARDASDTRSELGVRFDHAMMVNAMPLALRGRLAWAHDWIGSTGLTAAFQTLPGSSFIVNGAVPATNAMLASVGVDLHVTRNWSIAAKFDSELAMRSQTYAGTGTMRYVW